MDTESWFLFSLLPDAIALARLLCHIKYKTALSGSVIRAIENIF